MLGHFRNIHHIKIYICLPSPFKILNNRLTPTDLTNYLEEKRITHNISLEMVITSHSHTYSLPFSPHPPSLSPGKERMTDPQYRPIYLPAQYNTLCSTENVVSAKTYYNDTLLKPLVRKGLQLGYTRYHGPSVWSSLVPSCATKFWLDLSTCPQFFFSPSL